MRSTTLQDSRILTLDLSSHGQIVCVELSPFILSQDLILIGFPTKVLLGHLKIDEGLELHILSEFPNHSRCTALSISPETSVIILPNTIIFAAASCDFSIRIFSSDLRGSDSCKVLTGHTSYINDTKFDPDNNFLVSVSDDNTAKLWDTEDYKCVASFQLSSPGMSACWHSDDNSKLLVAEKIGLIRFYNVESRRPILSLDYGKPLSAVHWAPYDSQLVASLQLGELLVWDLTKPCVPLNNYSIFAKAGGHLRFSPFGELVATVNNLESVVKVVSVKNGQVKLSIPIAVPSNISWHCRCPIICVGDYKTLSFWKVVA